MERKTTLGMKMIETERHRRAAQLMMDEREIDDEAGESNTAEPGTERSNSNGDGEARSRDDEIIKELKNIKKQNLITHCLLASMIVLTLTWQLSEVSLILKIKQLVSNPLGSVAAKIRGFLKNTREANNQVQEMMKQTSQIPNQLAQTTSFPGLRIPELPHWELPGLDLESSDDEIE